MTAIQNPPGVPAPFTMSGRPSIERAARSFKPRGRMTPRLRQAFDTLAPVFLVTGQDRRFDPDAAFGRSGSLIVDLGFGMGDSTLSLARQHPDANVLGIDVHLPGIARVAEVATSDGLTNIRLIAADGIDVLRHMLAPESVSILQVAFPDPWPKPSQRHRRLVDGSFAALCASRLCLGGEIRLATDIDDYAEQMLAALATEPSLRNFHDAFAPRDTDRPVTKFERRALAAGRTIHDLRFRRVERPA